MEYKSEEEFLKNYDVNQYERPSVTSDVLLLSVSNGVQNNYRKLKEKFYSVLLVKRKEYPFKDKWCLPGGFVKIQKQQRNQQEEFWQVKQTYTIYLWNNYTLLIVLIEIQEQEY